MSDEPTRVGQWLDGIRNPVARVAATCVIGVVAIPVYLVAFVAMCVYETLRGFARGDEADF